MGKDELWDGARERFGHAFVSTNEKDVIEVYGDIMEWARTRVDAFLRTRWAISSECVLCRRNLGPRDHRAGNPAQLRDDIDRSDVAVDRIPPGYCISLDDNRMTTAVLSCPLTVRSP